MRNSLLHRMFSEKISLSARRFCRPAVLLTGILGWGGIVAPLGHSAEKILPPGGKNPPAAALRPAGLTGNSAVPPGGTLRFGEELTYAARWNGFPIGMLHARVWPYPRELNGRATAMLELQVEGNDFLSLFYPVSTTLKSFIDLKTGASLLYRRRSREGDYRANDRVVYQYDLRNALGTPEPLARIEQFERGIIGKTESKPLPGLVCDPVALAWRLRTLPLPPGGTTESLWMCDRYSSGQVRFRFGEPVELALPRFGVCRGRWWQPEVSGFIPGDKQISIVRFFVEERSRLILRGLITLPIGHISITLTRANNSAFGE